MCLSPNMAAGKHSCLLEWCHVLFCSLEISRVFPPTLFRKAQESQKEMKLLLDMYRSAPKEQRDKVQLMAAEKKAKAEVTISATAESIY